MNLSAHVTERFSAEQQQTLRLIAALSAETRTITYLVGGIVRDLLLDQPLNDLDIAVVGNAINFATQLHQQHGGELITHASFKTATWTPPSASKPIDLISARSETYAHPAALPTVTLGSMQADLQRRDFTINTLAMRLDGDAFGEGVDLFGGSADLRTGTVRILHSQSFVDDPTRIFRAIRYEQRLGFSLESGTLAALTAGLDGIRLLTPARLRHEFEHILAEPNRFAMLERMDRLGVLSVIDPQFRWQAAWVERFALLDRVENVNLFDARLLLWLSQLGFATQRSILIRLGATRKVLDSAEASHIIQSQLRQQPQNAAPSSIESILRPFRKQQLARLIARICHNSSHIGGWLRQYEAEWQHVRPFHDGNALRQIGLQPGPHFRIILDQLRAARLDGTVCTQADERVLLASILHPHR